MNYSPPAPLVFARGKNRKPDQALVPETGTICRLLGELGQTEANIVVAIVGLVVVALRRAQVPAVVVPAAATQNALLACASRKAQRPVCRLFACSAKQLILTSSKRSPMAGDPSIAAAAISSSALAASWPAPRLRCAAAGHR